MRRILRSSDRNLEERRTEYERGIRSLIGTMYEDWVNFSNTKYTEYRNNASELASTFLDNATATIKSEKMMDGLEAMLKDIAQITFDKESSQADSEVFRWKGDFNVLHRTFLEDMRTLGEDPEQNISSIYDLTEKFIMEATELTDRVVQDVSAGNYTFDTIQDAIVEVLRGGNSEDEFDRDVIEKEIAALIHGMADLFGAEEVKADKFVESTLNWIETKLDDYSDGNISSIPGKAIVAPLVLADFVLEKVKRCIFVDEQLVLSTC